MRIIISKRKAAWVAKLNEYGKTAEDVKALVKKYMIDTYECYNFNCERAKDMNLYDEKGNVYLDFYEKRLRRSIWNIEKGVRIVIKTVLAIIALIHLRAYIVGDENV